MNTQLVIMELGGSCLPVQRCIGTNEICRNDDKTQTARQNEKERLRLHVECGRKCPSPNVDAPSK